MRDPKGISAAKEVPMKRDVCASGSKKLVGGNRMEKKPAVVPVKLQLMDDPNPLGTHGGEGGRRAVQIDAIL